MHVCMLGQVAANAHWCSVLEVLNRPQGVAGVAKKQSGDLGPAWSDAIVFPVLTAAAAACVGWLRGLVCCGLGHLD